MSGEQPELLPLPGFYRRYELCVIAWFLLMLAVLLLNWWIFRTSDATIIFFSLCFVAISGLILIAKGYVLANLHCPVCKKTKLPQWNPSRVEGAPIQYFCSDCYVVWDTGLEYHDHSD